MLPVPLNLPERGSWVNARRPITHMTHWPMRPNDPSLIDPLPMPALHRDENDSLLVALWHRG